MTPLREEINHARQTDDDTQSRNAALHEMPGYGRSLHVHDPGVRTCTMCGQDWPCRLTELQRRDAARSTHEHWVDGEHFRAVAEELTVEARRGPARRAGWKVGTEESEVRGTYREACR
jgi:hypothetical protein